MITQITDFHGKVIKDASVTALTSGWVVEAFWGQYKCPQVWFCSSEDEAKLLLRDQQDSQRRCYAAPYKSENMWCCNLSGLSTDEEAYQAHGYAWPVEEGDLMVKHLAS